MVSFQYDAENQLVRIDFPDGGYAAYRYDALGKRIEKDVNGTITRYIYDGEDILFEYDGTNTLVARYTHGSGIDQPISMDRGGQSYFYHADRLGSIRVLTDISGNIVQTYQYDSFGNIVDISGSVVNPYTFTGREYDSESGLYYYRARYYDPEIGRFISEDPIGYTLRKVNPYIYVTNNPINFTDPTGMQEVGDVAGKVIGQIPPEILKMLTEWSVGSLTGAACAANLCDSRRHFSSVDWEDTVAECGLVLEELIGAFGIFGSSANLLLACAEECLRIIRFQEYQELCSSCPGNK